ncbi:hypothetical protein [Pseudomonas sp. EMN2]|uniref:hypothetical protein n=1 Tax=Pseudomonas sp. EMN2 TaxID=2615212 RepID=UPI00129B72BC|nr:hypothetical protein [Pseudomonas sp. EMN2]
MDPRIGMLNNGSFYAFVAGYAAEPVVGSLHLVEDALGLPRSPEAQVAMPEAAGAEKQLFNVVLRFEYPAWDEVEGIRYPDILADSKAQANAWARALADRDGHLCGGKGRVTFTATPH